MRRMGLRFCGTLWLVGSVILLAAPQEPVATQPGLWREWAAPDMSFASRFATPAEQQVFVPALRAVADTFRQIKALNPPVGFEVRPQAGIRGSIDEERRHGPIPGQLFLQFFAFHRTCPTCPIKASGESEVFVMVTANSVDTLYGDQDTVVSDQAGAMYLEPVRSGERGGFPEYERGLLVSRSAVPPFVPVSRERMLRAIIARAAKQSPDRLAFFEKELADLKASERAAQAWAGQGDYFGPVDPGDAGARRVVATNPAFFSAALPRTAIQSLVVRSSSTELTGAYMKGIEPAVLAMLDWKALAALLAK